jgi:hypothetical protein
MGGYSGNSAVDGTRTAGENNTDPIGVLLSPDIATCVLEFGKKKFVFLHDLDKPSFLLTL